jgi:hypothetical protein
MVQATVESQAEFALRRILWLAIRSKETGTRPTLSYLLHKVGIGRRGRQMTESSLVIESARQVVDAWPEIPPLLAAVSRFATIQLRELAIQPRSETKRDS